MEPPTTSTTTPDFRRQGQDVTLAMGVNGTPTISTGGEYASSQEDKNPLLDMADLHPCVKASVKDLITATPPIPSYNEMLANVAPNKELIYFFDEDFDKNSPYTIFDDWSLKNTTLPTYATLPSSMVLKEIQSNVDKAPSFPLPKTPWATLLLQNLCQWMHRSPTYNYASFQNLVTSLPTQLDFSLPLPIFMCMLLKVVLEDLDLSTYVIPI